MLAEISQKKASNEISKEEIKISSIRMLKFFRMLINKAKNRARIICECKNQYLMQKLTPQEVQDSLNFSNET